MRNKENLPNVDQPSTAFPMGRIRNDDGSGNGTPVVEQLYGDIVETVTSFMEEAKIVPNGLPDSAENGYQIAEAFKEVAGKFNQTQFLRVSDGILYIGCRLDNVQVGDSLTALVDENFDLSDVNFNKIKGSDGVREYDVQGITTIKPTAGDRIYLTKKGGESFKIDFYYNVIKVEEKLKYMPKMIRHGKASSSTNEGNGIFIIEHPLLTSGELYASNLFISISRFNVSFSPVTTQASYYVLDRHEGGFRVIFSNININSELDPNSRVVLDWQIVTYAN